MRLYGMHFITTISLNWNKICSLFEIANFKEVDFFLYVRERIIILWFEYYDCMIAFGICNHSSRFWQKVDP